MGYLGLKSHHAAKRMGILFFRNAESKAYRADALTVGNLKEYKYVFIASRELKRLNIGADEAFEILNKDEERNLIETIRNS